MDARKIAQGKGGKEPKDGKQLFRYWAEVREIARGSALNLLLSAMAKIHIRKNKEKAERTDSATEGRLGFSKRSASMIPR